MEGQEADGELYPIAVLIDELKVGLFSSAVAGTSLIKRAMIEGSPRSARLL